MSVLDQIEQRHTNGSQKMSGDRRAAALQRTSLIGIVANIALVAMKFSIGLSTKSVAVMSDAANNLCDAFSSVLVIVGSHFANKLPDQEHPFGYGRAEYIATITIGAIIIFNGANALNEGVGRLIEPEPTSYTPTSIALLAVAIVVKVILGVLFRRRGKQLNSDALVASGTDALLDVVMTSATIASAYLTVAHGIQTEAFVSIGISLIILKAGIDVLLQSFSQILGKRTDPEVVSLVKSSLEGVKGVERICDLKLYDLGPKTLRGSVYVEVDEGLGVTEGARIARSAQLAAYANHGVMLDAVGIYPVSSSDATAVEMRDTLERLALAHEGVWDLHGFHLSRNPKLASFELTVDYHVKDRDALADAVAAEARDAYPDFTFFVMTTPRVSG